jgi:hypothetical protein
MRGLFLFVGPRLVGWILMRLSDSFGRRATAISKIGCRIRKNFYTKNLKSDNEKSYRYLGKGK